MGVVFVIYVCENGEGIVFIVEEFIEDEDDFVLVLESVDMFDDVMLDDELLIKLEKKKGVYL